MWLDSNDVILDLIFFWGQIKECYTNVHHSMCKIDRKFK